MAPNCIRNLIFFDNSRYARNRTSSSGNQNLRPLYNIYFFCIDVNKWSQISTRTIKTSFFKDIFFGLFSIEIPITTFKSGNMTKLVLSLKAKTVLESGECIDHFSSKKNIFISQSPLNNHPNGLLYKIYCH